MFSIAFSGPAWSWVNTAWLIIATYLNKLWYKVYWDKEYQSIIKWWNNTFIVYFDEKDIFLSKKINLFFAFDNLSIQRNQKIYEIENIIAIPYENWLYQNIISVWAAFKSLGIPVTEAINHLKDYFSYKILPDEIIKKNIESLKIGYKIEISKTKPIKKIWEPSIFQDWNKTIAEWALKGWLEFYSAYPMTPASSLIKYLSNKITFFQGEDEIAVAMSMLGARFAGKKAMCWTSGWWFALMVESISFANQAEIWWVYILSQRWGPSTWTPTFTEQWDILFACNPTFWDTKPIVIYPNTFENWYNLIQKALNWSEIYQHPIVVLLDKQFSESYYTLKLKEENNNSQINIDEIKFNPTKPEKFKEFKSLQEDKFLRYKINENGISAYTYPWIKNWEFIASSYEHTESWFSTEDPEIKQKMTEKRHKKLKTFKNREFNENFYGYEIINPDAKKFIITTGINHLVCKKFAQDNNWWLITITMIQPLDTRFKKYLENAEEIVFVELNKSWQLQQIVSCEIWLNCQNYKNKVKHIRKYNNYPLFIEDLNKLL